MLHKHASPVPVVNVKVVLNHAAICDLKMPAVRDVFADGSPDARWLARFEDYDDGVGLGSVKIRVKKIVATTFRRIDDWDVAFCNTPSPRTEIGRQCRARSSVSPGIADDRY